MRQASNMKSGRSMFPLFIIMMTHLMTTTLATSHDCETEHIPPFTRLMLITFNGKRAQNATRQNFMDNYGGCRNVMIHATKAFDYLEKAFGLDLSASREDPFKALDLESHSIQAYVVNHQTSRALMGSFYEFGEYMSAPVYSSFWRLSVKAPVNGTKGAVGSGCYLYFGLLRVSMNGRNICMDFYSEEPVVRVDTGMNGYELQPFALYNAEWGVGASTGVLPGDMQGEEKGRGRPRSYFWVVRFPPNGYN